MSRRSKFTAIALALMVLGGLAGCGSSKGNSAGAKAPIRVGVIFSTSGVLGDIGKLDRDGAVLARDVINRQGGILGHQLQFLLEDDETSPDKAVILANKLVTQDKVDAVIGPTTGTASIAIEHVFEQNHVPLLTPVGAAPAIKPGNKWSFRVFLNDDQQTVDETLLLIKRLYPANVKLAIVHQDDAYGQTSSAAFVKKAPSYGIQIVGSQQFALTATDMTPQLVRLRPLHPDAAIVVASSQAGSIIMRNARQLGMLSTTNFIGSTGNMRAATWTIAGAAAEGMLVPTVIDPTNVLDRQKFFYSEFKKAYATRTPDKEPTAWDAIGWDAVWLLKKAIENSGAFTPDAIEKGLEQVKEYPLVSGIYTYGTDNREGIRYTPALIWVKVQGGRFVTCKECIPPNPQATMPAPWSS